MTIGVLLNILLFASLFRTNENVVKYSEDFHFDYGFLYKHKNINITRNIFFGATLFECIISVLILITYITHRLPNYLYYEIPESEQDKYYRYKEESSNIKVDLIIIELYLIIIIIVLFFIITKKLIK